MRIKGIVHSVLNDAPFIGAIIVAPSCPFNCPGCQNRHLLEGEGTKTDAQGVLDEVERNPMNEGVILGGLEWTASPEALRALVNESLRRKLKVMIYTGMTEKVFQKQFKDLYGLPLYVKFGQYLAEKATSNNVQYGVRLASSNQHIEYLGGD